MDQLGAVAAASWYADPYGRAVQRYWNGAAWTPYVIDASGQQRVEDAQGESSSIPNASAQGHGIVIQNIVHSPQPAVNVLGLSGGLQAVKSTGTAVVLTILFGPLGLFYASIVGGLILTAITVVTLGLGIFLTWPLSIIWAIVAVNNHNQALMTAMRSTQPIHSHPYGHVQHLPNPGPTPPTAPPMGLPRANER